MNIKELAIQKGSRLLLKGKKYSPEICIAVGIACGVTGLVLACKATLKAGDILDLHSDMMDKIQEAVECAENDDEIDYTKEDQQRDTFIAYAKTATGLAKLYSPAVIFEVSSIVLILSGFGIMRKRNIALVAAYNGLSETFEKYRKRVIEDFGEQYDEDVRNGVRRNAIKATEIGDNGKKKKVDQEVVTRVGGPLSQYARCFDEKSLFHKKNPELNLLFLRTQQNYANDILRIRGHLFLNEVYEMLDIPHSSEGAIVGWILEKGKPNFVDFGIYNLENDRNRRFVNGDEYSVWLDFNVDGIIFDKI